ncbi:MAG: ABC transporter ATP-binding protein [Treponema sp.]|nr:ABC transporter ATP-binding protein [Treponema sp.]
MILKNVKKKLGNFSLCIDELVISKPGIYGLTGSNGCGKSTLAKIMTGLLEPDSGTVDTESLTLQDITYLSRKPYMMDDTVYNNLVYPLKLRGIEPEQKLIDEFLNRMRFLKRAKEKAKGLSGGEQQKLAFLRAIIFKPKFIIADEAMSAFDMESINLFEKIIMEEQQKESSIWVIISHQMPHLKNICNSFFSMSEGKLC